jgi:NADH dehydrogenase FAD-containing subunit
MNLNDLDIYFEIFKTVFSFIGKLTVQKGKAFIHRYTYRATPDPHNVIVVGGSFAGALLAQRLAHTLPSGYRVILVEMNSHFNYAFAFPRNAVFSGREHHTFVSYENLTKGAPEGIFRQYCDEVTDVTESHVNTASGTSLPYEYLIVATGAAQPPPARLLSRNKQDGIQEFRGYQQRIGKADRVAVIGGGAVGIELVTEIREKYPDKEVTLIHSRQQLLPRFGPKLHDRVMGTLRKQNIEVLLGERPLYPSDAGQHVQETNLTLADGKERTWDLVVCERYMPCSTVTDFFDRFLAQVSDHDLNYWHNTLLKVSLPMARSW